MLGALDITNMSNDDINAFMKGNHFDASETKETDSHKTRLRVKLFKYMGSDNLEKAINHFLETHEEIDEVISILPYAIPDDPTPKHCCLISFKIKEC